MQVILMIDFIDWLSVGLRRANHLALSFLSFLGSFCLQPVCSLALLVCLISFLYLSKKKKKNCYGRCTRRCISAGIDRIGCNIEYEIEELYIIYKHS